MNLKLLSGLLCALLLALALAPGVALAQGSDWRELRTEQFAILHDPDDQETAVGYAAWVDSVYDEVSAVFGHQVATPITLRLYPSMERYIAANPLARGMPGVVAHADYRRREVVVIVPQTRNQTEQEIQNNVRHELTHIVASDLSDERLNVLFQEGVAQYVELPSRELEVKIEYLRRAVSDGDLPRWSQLADRETFYGRPEINYPVSLSVVAFLVERHSFVKLRDLLTITGRSSGYRSALERTYGLSPDVLEQEWRAWLSSYLEGGYRRSALNAYDLSRAEELLRRGRYGAAGEELTAAIEWLRSSGQAEALQQAEALLQRSVQGQQAEKTASDALGALTAGDYARASALVEEARAAFTSLDDRRQDAVLNDYAERVQRGLRAESALRDARVLSGSFRYPEARALADQAAGDFQALGAGSQAEAAMALRAQMDRRQWIAGALLLVVGVGGVLASALRRMTVREAEAW